MTVKSTLTSRNCRVEFEATAKLTSLKCAIIWTEWMEARLMEGFTEAEYDEFLRLIDFYYDYGFGNQVVHGTIWMDNGTWFERVEYDGSENWRIRVYPEINDKLRRM